MMDYGLSREGGPMHMRSSIIDHQSSMQRGFTLTELLVVVVIGPFVMVALSSLFRTFIYEVPQGTRLVQQNTTVLHLIAWIRQDMDRAVGLPRQFDGRRVDETTLLIEQADGVVCYRFESGRTVRTLLDRQGTASPGEQRVWEARDAVIQWRPWIRDGGAYAAELHSHVQQRVAGESKRKLPGSYVFFVRHASKGGETQ